MTSKCKVSAKPILATADQVKSNFKEHTNYKLVIGQRRKYEAESAVFNNPLLLDHILAYVVYNQKRTQISRSDVVVVRCVARKWLESASRVLKKSTHAVIEIKLGDNSQLNGKTKKDSKKLFEKYSATFVQKSDFKDSLLTSKFIVREEFFYEKGNLKTLKNFLNCSRENLYSLELNLPTWCPKLQTFGTFDFPILRDLSFHWRPNMKNLSSKQQRNRAVKDFLEITKSILNGANNLKQFKYNLTDNNIIKNITLWRLPPTMNAVKSYSYNFTLDHDFFMKNHLHNLIELDLAIMGTEVKDHDLFNVLDRFRATLKRLQLYRMGFEEAGPVTFLRIPLMEQLELLRISSSYFELNSNMNQPLSKYLPKLKTFPLGRQTECSYLKWIENSRFENINEFDVYCHNKEYPAPHNKHIKSPSLRFMDQLVKTFSNVQKLHFFYNLDDIESLKILFRDCVQLKELEIDFTGKFCPKTTQVSLMWTFLSVRVKKMKDINKKFFNHPPCEWPELDLIQDHHESIFNLKELTSLRMYRYPTPGDDFKCFMELLCNALNKLPKLKTKFSGGLETCSL